MATQPTQNPVPSETPRDLKFNAGKIDEFVTSQNHSYTDRLGQKHRTISGINYDAAQAITGVGFITVDSFQAGATLTSPNQALRDTSTGLYYRWDGSFPKTVPAGSTPASTGGVGFKKWLLVAKTDMSRVLQYQIARMAAGEAVKIACYGDSTVDGFATTSWTANPVSGGNAVGNSNHNLTAPNSWPVKLQAILQEIFGNPLVSVFNAGYAGKSLADGWAYQNYDTAITNNPFYGKPDITLIDFGLNDVRPAGSQIEEFKAEAESLAEKLMIQGTLPVFVSSDPILRNYNVTNAIFNREVTTQIEEVKKDICQRLGIPYIDKATDLLNWLSNNKDGYQWMVEQSTDTDGDGVYSSADDVGLHFRDNGHSIKAQIIAAQLFPDTIFYEGGDDTITSADSRSNSFGNFLTTLNGTQGPNNKQGFAFKVNYYDQNTAHKPAGPLSPMSTLWVFNRNPDAKLIYRGLVGEGWGIDNPNNVASVPTTADGAPRVSVKNITTGADKRFIPAAVGWRYSGFYKPSDVPYMVGKLPLGLSKIQYLCGDFRQYNDGSNSIFFYGNFEIIERNDSAGSVNCLRNSGEMLRAFTAADKKLVLLPEQSDGSNLFGLMGGDGTYPGDALDFLVDATMPIGSGVVLAHTSSFGGIAAGNPDHYGARTATVLYRNAVDKVRLALVKQDIDGDIISVFRTAQSSAITFTADRAKLRVHMARDFVGNTQAVSVYDAYNGNLISTTTFTYADLPLHFAGAGGGVYWDGSVAGAGIVGLHYLSVVRS